MNKQLDLKLSLSVIFSLLLFSCNVNLIESSYTVTFDANGGVFSSNQSDSIQKTVAVALNAKISFPEEGEFSKEGYSFLGWTNANGVSYQTDTAITSDLTLYAKWEKKGFFHEVTFDINGGAFSELFRNAIPMQLPTFSIIENNVRQMVTNKGISVPPQKDDVIRGGYTFGGWYTDNSFNMKFDFNTQITNNLTLYAKWVNTAYTVTFDTRASTLGITLSITAQTVLNGETAVRPADSKVVNSVNGFHNWYSDTNFATVFDFTTTPITSNTTVYARWQKAVAFDLKSGESFSDIVNAGASQLIVAEGDKATNLVERIPSKDNYKFDGWYSDSTFNNEFTTNTVVTRDVILYPRWKNQPKNKAALISLITPMVSSDPSTNLNHIDTTLIKDMSQLFYLPITAGTGASRGGLAVFSGDISSWNVSNVTNMSQMFRVADKFNNDISGWDVSKVKNLEQMFSGADAFRQNLSSWQSKLPSDAIKTDMFYFGEPTAAQWAGTWR